MLTGDGYETTGVQGDIAIQHRPHAVYHCGMDNRCGCIEIVAYFGTSSFKVENGRTIFLVNLNTQLDLEGKYTAEEGKINDRGNYNNRIHTER